MGIDELLKLCKKKKIRRGFGESGIIRHAIEPAFKRRMRETGTHVAITYLPSAGKKESRVLSFQSLVKNGKVHIPNCPWGDRLIDQLVDFPGRSHDDGVDVCSLAGRALDDLQWSRNLVIEEIPREARFGSVEWLMSGTEDAPKNNRTVF